MEIKTLTGLTLEDAYTRLDRLLPDNAYKAITGGKGAKLDLTDIQPAFLPELLTELFGFIGWGWGFDVKMSDTKAEMVKRKDYEELEYLASCTITPWYRVLNEKGEILFCSLPTTPGANKNTSQEWAEKGAVTNALGTAWSFAGYQKSVYKGERGHTSKQLKPKSSAKSEPIETIEAPKYEKFEQRVNATEDDFMNLKKIFSTVKLESKVGKTGRRWYAGGGFWLTQAQYDELKNMQIMATEPVDEPLPF